MIERVYDTEKVELLKLDENILELNYNSGEKCRIQQDDADKITECIAGFSKKNGHLFSLLIIINKNTVLTKKAMRVFAKFKKTRNRALIIRNTRLPIHKILNLLIKFSPRFKFRVFINRKNAIYWLNAEKSTGKNLSS